MIQDYLSLRYYKQIVIYKRKNHKLYDLSHVHVGLPLNQGRLLKHRLEHKYVYRQAI